MTSKIFLDRMKAVFDGSKVDGVIIEAPIDLFYLTGLNLSAGVLFLSKNGGELLVDGRYIAAAKKNAPCTCTLISPEALEKTARTFRRLGFDATETSYQRWEQLKKISNELVPLKKPTEEARVLKSVSELKALKKSAALLWKGYLYIRKILKIGMTEQEVAMRFELFCRQHGAEKLGFDPIIAFGKNTAYPHYRPTLTKLKKGDIVLCDLGVVVDRYYSDMTRTFFFGKPETRLLVFQNVVKEAHDAALKLCRPGVKVGELDKVATKVIKEAGLEKYLAHSLGHGVGLEIHEFPRLKDGGADHNVLLKEGMVITIEPGLYWPGVGGVRYEDTIVITKKGYQNWYP